jgi:hypothetical protein
MNEVIALVVVLGIWLSMTVGCFAVYRSSRKRSEELALHAPLHPEYGYLSSSLPHVRLELTVLLPNRSQVHRTDAALSQAGEGFNVCVGCGFQNFKRAIFCQLCGETMEEPLRNPMESKKDKKSRESAKDRAHSATSPRGEMLSSVASVARQQRARCRPTSRHFLFPNFCCSRKN